MSNHYLFFFSANFGPWSTGPQHGFARITRWQLEQAPIKVNISRITMFCYISFTFFGILINYLTIVSVSSSSNITCVSNRLYHLLISLAHFTYIITYHSL